MQSKKIIIFNPEITYYSFLMFPSSFIAKKVKLSKKEWITYGKELDVEEVDDKKIVSNIACNSNFGIQLESSEPMNLTKSVKGLYLQTDSEESGFFKVQELSFKIK